MRSIQLKVKIKALAEEARIIRREEKQAKQRGQFVLCNDLHNHRVTVVRAAARSTLLAYQFLRGIRYELCERDNIFGRPKPDTKAISTMVCKYGQGYYDRVKTEYKIVAWMKGAALEDAA